jgi:hypothetical protein
MIVFQSPLTDVAETPQGFGLRLSSAAFACLCPGQSARGLAHSKTPARKGCREIILSKTLGRATRGLRLCLPRLPRSTGFHMVANHNFTKRTHLEILKTLYANDLQKYSVLTLQKANPFSLALVIQSLSKEFKAFQSYSKVLEKKIIFRILLQSPLTRGSGYFNLFQSIPDPFPPDRTLQLSMHFDDKDNVAGCCHPVAKNVAT